VFPRRFLSPFRAPVPLLLVRSFATAGSSVSKDKRDLPKERENARAAEGGGRGGTAAAEDGERGRVKNEPAKEGVNFPRLIVTNVH